jgi:hypothetical protein
MNTANLQLEGFYLVIAALNNALVAKGIMTREEVDGVMRVAEETALIDPGANGMSPPSRDAITFPARLLRLANNGASDGQIQPFSELAKLVGQTKGAEPPAEVAAVDPSEIEFYRGGNGDKWALVTDVGGRRFVRHTPTHLSGGQVSLSDLESFRERDPDSPQNEALETLLEKHLAGANQSREAVE